MTNQLSVDFDAPIALLRRQLDAQLVFWEWVADVKLFRHFATNGPWETRRLYLQVVAFEFHSVRFIRLKSRYYRLQQPEPWATPSLRRMHRVAIAVSDGG